MKTKIRLDQLLCEKGFCQSRSRGRDLILQNLVKVNGQLQTKPSAATSSDAQIEILTTENYVSRGAQKLQHAIKKFRINITNIVAADIGASTGGFTDYLLQNGAKKVYAIDVGHSQLAEKLTQNHQVINLESTDIRTLKTLPEKVSLIVADLSYISLRLVLPHLSRFTENAETPIIVLFKPQFEAGPKLTPKDGVIKDPQIIETLLTEFQTWCTENHFHIAQKTPSPITGKSGNQEYLLLLFTDNREI